jgi:ribosomal protein S10
MRITIEAYKHDRVDDDGQDAAALDEETEKISTVVYLSEASAHQEIKQPSKTLRWEGL